MKSIIQFVSNFAPLRYKSWVEENLRYANFSMNPWKFIGLTILYGFSFACVTATILYFLKFNFLLILAGGLASFFAVFAILNSIVIVVVGTRSKFAEEMLPDVLQLMATNMRSGLAPDQALLVSARPEFGFLEIEIKNAAKELFSGATIDEALGKISNKIKSKTLSNTIKLIIEGIKKGGELSKLLEQTAEDVRNTRILKKEIAAQVTMYAIFIFFATAIGAPFLYSISNFLAEAMAGIGKRINIDNLVLPNTGLIKLNKISIDPSFLNSYSLAALTITSIFGGIIIGLILEGSEKSGIKYIPVMLIISLVIYLGVKPILASTLGVFSV